MQHQQLSAGRWFHLSFFEQMGNIGSEIERAISWKNKNKDFSDQAINRALELLSLSIDDKKNILRLKELTRVYESIGDYFYGNNVFKSNDLLWQKYFYNFAFAIRNKII
jgi:hypothetical protein